MSTGILAFSAKGFALGERIAALLPESSLTRCEKGGLAAWTEAHFAKDDLLVFVGSCGIAVRAIAPFVCHKTKDPAVLVVDETGKYAVSLLSGHIGGANHWCEYLARKLGAEPVITTATDRNGVFAVDTWAKAQGLVIKNPERIGDISSALLEGKTIGFTSDFPVEGEPPKGVFQGGKDFSITLSSGEGLILIPKIVTLGVGCRKDTPVEKIEEAFQNMLAFSGVTEEAISQVCSVDLKANEKGLLSFCRRRSLPFVTYTAGELGAVAGDFTPSAFVKSVVGVDNVCERSAVLGSGGRLLVRKQAGGGVTMALAVSDYTVTFQNKGEKT